MPEGWLFVGHAEVLHWMNDRMEPKPGNIYRRRPGDPERAKGGARAVGPAPSAPPPAPRASSPRPRYSELNVLKGPTPLPARTTARAYTPIDDQLEVVNINVGETHASKTPVEIKTLLGSCVAACMYDPVAKVGGMNHFLLPHTPATHDIDRQRFGTHAMETLINGLMSQGADRSRLEAKIFGGGNVLDGVTRRPTVGEQNAAFAIEFLKNEGIKLTSSRLGGDTGVEVRFHPHTGRAFVRDISRDLIDITREEADEMPVQGGDAELFTS